MSSFSDRLKSWPLYWLPHHACSRLVLRLTRLQSRWVPVAISRFSRVFGVNLQEAKYPDPTHYRTFNEFFTRELKASARTLDNSANSIACPVDGRVSQAGAINGDTLIQAKGIDYSMQALLGGRPADAAAFENGIFTTLYLSPKDYHRIHMPLDGTLRAMHYIPGRLFSVAPHTVRTVPRLFARNERVAAIFDTTAGKMAMVLVGAINVAAIETVWAGLVTPPAGNQTIHRDYQDNPPILAKGDEMGRFNMGSTVILLFEKGSQWSSELVPDEAVQLGRAIGLHQSR